MHVYLKSLGNVNIDSHSWLHLSFQIGDDCEIITNSDLLILHPSLMFKHKKPFCDTECSTYVLGHVLMG